MIRSILASIITFLVTSVVTELRGQWHAQDVVKPWIAMVDARDKASVAKDRIADEAIAARDNYQAEVQQLQAQIDGYEISRKIAPVCNWSNDDARVLNTGTSNIGARSR